MKWRQAAAIANKIIGHLEPHCERICAAGSVRRQKFDVKDIEVVAIPKVSPVTNLFGERVYDHAAIEIASLKLGQILKAGERYKQIRLAGGINLDLYMVTPPAQWGVILATRTGPAEFSKWLVTQRFLGGILPSHAYVRDGAVWVGGSRFWDEANEKWIWSGGEIMPMLEEKDYFEFLGLAWMEPEHREAQWKREAGWK